MKNGFQLRGMEEWRLTRLGVSIWILGWNIVAFYNTPKTVLWDIPLNEKVQSTVHGPLYTLGNRGEQPNPGKIATSVMIR